MLHNWKPIPDCKTQYHQLTLYKFILTSPTDTHTRPRDTTPNEVSNNQTIHIQHQALSKGRQMATILKGNIDQKQKSQYSWLVKTIKKINGRPIKEIRLTVLSFNQTQAAALHNSNIFAAFDGNLGKAIKSSKVSPI